MQAIWYFKNPIIGYCRECNTTNTNYSSDEGLKCAKCRKPITTTFNWDEESTHPEE